MGRIPVLAVVFFFVSCNSQTSVSSVNREIVFHAVNVIPMDNERIMANQDVVVKDGKIAAIGDAGKINFGKDALIIDGNGKYLLPGLTEMHAHIPPIDDIEPMKNVLLLFAANGITTIRGMLGHPKHLQLRKMVADGEITGPHIYTAGPGLSGGSVKSPQQADSIVRAEKKEGYDFLKLLPGLSKENFTVIEKTAKEVDIPFAGHVSYDVGVWRAIDAGYGTIDHLDGFVRRLFRVLRT